MKQHREGSRRLQVLDMLTRHAYSVLSLSFRLVGSIPRKITHGILYVWRAPECWCLARCFFSRIALNVHTRPMHGYQAQLFFGLLQCQPVQDLVTLVHQKAYEMDECDTQDFTPKLRCFMLLPEAVSFKPLCITCM